MASDSKTLAGFVRRNDSLAVLSGAGVSTASGIPDYRDRNGAFKPKAPIQYGDFVNKEDSRRRYWARSYVGWPRFSEARPNAAHRALARLEEQGRVDTLITQNVDRLHHAAGSRQVIELHGDLSKVRCLGCDDVRKRSAYQDELRETNPGWHAAVARYTPDGDAELGQDDYRDFAVPPCRRCGGLVKPDVVMFGEAVPKPRVRDANAVIDRADALLVVGSSLMVFSGFRFARQAAEQGKPIAIVNRGRTRADDLATLKIEADCATVLTAALEALPAG